CLPEREIAMCNGSWVCFKCRIVSRRRSWRLVTYLRPWIIGHSGGEHIVCSRCHRSLVFLGPTIQVPQKTDVKGWRALQRHVESVRAAALDKRVAELVRRRHGIEQRIRDIKSR